MNVLNPIKEWLEEVGKVTSFSFRFFREVIRPPFEIREFLVQCFEIGYKSIFLVAVTGFIMGVVFTLQTRPTMIEFGAVSYMPGMISISIIREIGPMITALICAGKIGSGIAAELGSMKVTEQIDAMEVSGTNPFNFLVVSRVLATTLMLPLLVILADAMGIWGSFIVENLKGDVTFKLYFYKAFKVLFYSDVIPAMTKSYFFGFAIGIIGCYKGYYSTKGTAGVGRTANEAVVISSLLLFLIDFLAVLVADIFYEI